MVTGCGGKVRTKVYSVLEKKEDRNTIVVAALRQT